MDINGIEIRKFATFVEEVFHEGGPVAERPLKLGAIAAVVRNPFAGRYVPDILPMMEQLRPLGLEMSTRLAKALTDGDLAAIEGFGKGAIVGSAGELEHGALWHVPGGYAMRDLLGKARAIVPSTKKVGPVGARLDVPVTHINASYVRGHFNAMEVGVNDAPRADEMVLILAMATAGRVHARLARGFALEDRGKPGVPA